MTIGLAAKALTGKATHVATNLVQPSTEWFSSVSKEIALVVKQCKAVAIVAMP